MAWRISSSCATNSGHPTLTPKSPFFYSSFNHWTFIVVAMALPNISMFLSFFPIHPLLQQLKVLPSPKDPCYIHTPPSKRLVVAFEAKIPTNLLVPIDYIVARKDQNCKILDKIFGVITSPKTIYRSGLMRDGLLGYSSILPCFPFDTNKFMISFMGARYVLVSL